MDRATLWPLICLTLFAIAAVLFLIAGAKRRRLDRVLLSAAAAAAPQVSTKRQLSLFTRWQPGSSAALASPERRWTYDQDYIIAFVAALEGTPALRYYAHPILRIDIWFALLFAAFVACAGLLAADHLVDRPWLARAAILAACLGVVYGAADVAEELKLRGIFAQAERVSDARNPEGASLPTPEDGSILQPRVADAAEVDAANALTRIKLVMLAASVIGGVAFGILLIADLLVGAASRGPGSGASTPTPDLHLSH